jgi:thioredoxin-like negative regulator of GroEL
MGDTMSLECPSCKAINCVPVEKAGEVGKCGECKGELCVPLEIGRPVDVDDDTFDAEVRQSKLPVVVEFWSPSCGHCIKMEKVLGALAEELSGRVKVAKMNILSNRRIPSDYEVRGTPMFLHINGGKVRATALGAMSKGQLKEKLGL